ncbi:sulfate permease, SulP family [Chitinophaga terrae (ex Kim and Jung 2007)]|uniref:Sulfate permease, SulP family n=1 Tax=Chitinophaga terrae (ex Kim and Jung 2007) TaxID=408074 RepID=A0A1H4BML0_9BACT|nr:sulfate permease [Chitinophaga terrae (ex Kim and Jung 2007)]GEP89663.1 sodium-independent anion transporter [Chitinophaga terrae (ex Kim and Jung 2007)]SEA49380.1 sulfate permease, SulP family [Chitinophaga terrae (ex Kim and Jung 2007)]
MFTPKLLETLKGYTRIQFVRDLLAGLIVGIVALPLAIAFAIASGVSPEKGLYTAVIAGFIISAFGGSKVQIGGPTGAFIIIVYGIVQQHGVSGLIIATFMAGVILIIMGIARLGSVIKFIPHPLIVGFTSGIALVIFSSQIKDFFGLEITSLPSDFIKKWIVYGQKISSINYYSLAIAVFTTLVVFLWPRVTHRVPGSLVAIILSTLIATFFHLPIDTIGSRFGRIPTSLPLPSLPNLDFDTIKLLIQPAFTIALLGGIESLLSAVVADGMIGGKHKSNMELVAQGIANIFSSLFGGIPATGAIARTATNIKNGGRTPVAGIIHSLTLLLIIMFAGKWAALIPMATLAGILVVVTYNMSEWENFVSIAKGSKNDAAVLIVTFLLTVIIDLTVAIEIGMVLSMFLFMRKMAQFSNVSVISKQFNGNKANNDPLAVSNFIIPHGVEVFEITGPLFFGAAYKFKDAIRIIEAAPQVLIIRMRNVPIIDATGIQIIKEVSKDMKHQGTKLILSEVLTKEVFDELRKARLLFSIGKSNVVETFAKAIERSEKVILEKKGIN